MRVLLIGDYPPPYGGIAVQVQHLSWLLRERGVENRVLNIGKGRGVMSPECDTPHSKIDLFFKLIRYARSKYLLHLFTNGENWKSWAMALAVTGTAWLTQARAILTITSGGAPAYLAGAPRLIRALARFVVRLPIAIVCRTDAIARTLSGWRPTGVIVLPAFSASRIRPADHPPEAVARFCSNRRPLLVSVVILRREYDLPTLLEAFRDLRRDYPMAGLVVIGGGEEETQVQNLVCRWELEESVLLAGWVRHDECLAIIQQADLFLRTTMYDGDASSIREALALGVPVVATKTDFRPEGVFLVPPGDPQALRAMVAEVLACSEPRQGPNTLAHPSTDGILLALYERLSGNGRDLA